MDILRQSNEVIYIDPMLPTDIDAVMRIDHLCFPCPWSPEIYHVEMRNRAASYLAARNSCRVVGYGGMWVIAGECHITSIAVEPEYRRRKIGERLLQSLLEEAISKGAGHVTLEVRESNLAAQRLYRKYGFDSQGLRIRYYTDNGENAVVMWAVGVTDPEYQSWLRERGIEIQYQLS